MVFYFGISFAGEFRKNPAFKGFRVSPNSASMPPRGEIAGKSSSKSAFAFSEF